MSSRARQGPVVLASIRLPAMSVGEAEPLFALPPERRGFWTDEELMEWSGLASVPTLRKLQAARWLIADRAPRRRGGHQRVWVFREVVLASVAVELSKATAIGLLPAAALLARVSSSWVQEAVALDERLTALLELREPASAASRHLVLIDMVEAWAEVESGDYELVSDQMTLGSGPHAIPRPMSRRLIKRRAIEEKGAAQLWVDFARLPLPPLQRLLEKISTRA